MKILDKLMHGIIFCLVPAGRKFFGLIALLFIATACTQKQPLENIDKRHPHYKRLPAIVRNMPKVESCESNSEHRVWRSVKDLGNNASNYVVSKEYCTTASQKQFYQSIKKYGIKYGCTQISSSATRWRAICNKPFQGKMEAIYIYDTLSQTATAHVFFTSKAVAFQRSFSRPKSE